MENGSTHILGESVGGLVLDAVLRSYSIIYFSQRRWMGALLLAGTLCWPLPGLLGLAGVAISLGAAVLMGFDRGQLRTGSYLFNSLLISLAIGHLFALGYLGATTLVILLPVTSVLTLFLTVAASNLMYQTFGLPALSVPFVAAQFVLFFLLPAAHAPLATAVGMDSWSVADVPLREYGLAYLRAFGGILFLPYASFGLLALGALLVHSRLTVLYATAGIVVGMTTLSLLPLGVSFSAAEYLAFNFMYCGIALGGVFVIPSRATLGLVVAGAALCAVVAGAVVTVFAPLGFSPIALPFNLVTLLILYVMKLRTTATGIHLNPFAALSPEESFAKFHTSKIRFPDWGYPTIQCPFMGERVVTQGVDGPLTHRRRWKYALDFEVLDEPWRRHPGAARQLESYYTFNTPVLCPDDGFVAKTINHVEDRPIGSNNFAENWGNLVIIRLDSGPYVKLCHLRQRSITVRDGERVRRGQIIGYCGNSGRSPVPHLHVQLQASPHVGAATIPFRLRHYFERDARRIVYRTAGIPAENARVEGATVERRIAACFDNISRREFVYRVCQQGRESQEVISCDVDEVGNYVFSSLSGERLTASVCDHAFYGLDFQGDRGVLFWLWLGLARVPFISKPQAQWHDTIDVRPLLRPWARFGYDLVGPFFNYPSLETTGTIREPGSEAPRQATICVETTLHCDVATLCLKPESTPPRIRTYIAEKEWVVAVKVDLNQPLSIEQI